jgi:hypothetical protein
MKLEWIKLHKSHEKPKWRLIRGQKTIAEIWKETSGIWFGITVKGELRPLSYNSRLAKSIARKG